MLDGLSRTEKREFFDFYKKYGDAKNVTAELISETDSDYLIEYRDKADYFPKSEIGRAQINESEGTITMPESLYKSIAT